MPIAGLVDKEAEISRLEKEISKLDIEVSRLRGKLGNAAFIDKAPAAVVNKEQEKLQAQEQALETLQEQLRRIGNL